MNYPGDRLVAPMQDEPMIDEKMLADAPQAEVPHAMDRLEMAHSRLHEAIGALHDRLAPVRNEHSTQNEGDKAARGYGSKLAGRIGEEASRAETATDVIVKILNELEV